MDNHDDTHCFGETSSPISLTLDGGTVSTYLHEHPKQAKIPICTGMTALKIDSGEVVILEFGRGLCFVNHTEKSLIDPNK